jgi:hypothetical protein
LHPAQPIFFLSFFVSTSFLYPEESLIIVFVLPEREYHLNNKKENNLLVTAEQPLSRWQQSSSLLVLSMQQ